MDIKTVIFLNEDDVRDIISKHIENKYKKKINDFKIIVRDPKSIPQGAIAGDCVGMNITLDEKTSISNFE